MLDNLISVAVSIIPDYCINHTHSKEDLMKYNLYLEIAKNQVLENFFKFFPHPKTGLPIKEFLETFSNETIAKLFNSKKLRLYTFEVAVSLEATDLKLHKYLVAKSGDVRNSTADTEDNTLEGYILKYTSRHPFSREKRPLMMPFLKILVEGEVELDLAEKDESNFVFESTRTKSALFNCDLSSIGEDEEEGYNQTSKPTGIKAKKKKNKRIKKKKIVRPDQPLGLAYLLNTPNASTT